MTDSFVVLKVESSNSIILEKIFMHMQNILMQQMHSFNMRAKSKGGRDQYCSDQL